MIKILVRMWEIGLSYTIGRDIIWDKTFEGQLGDYYHNFKFTRLSTL